MLMGLRKELLVAPTVLRYQLGTHREETPGYLLWTGHVESCNQSHGFSWCLLGLCRLEACRQHV